MRETDSPQAMRPSQQKRGRNKPGGATMAAAQGEGKQAAPPHAANGSPPRIEGKIESVSPQGVVLGWVRDAADPSPCQVQIWHPEPGRLDHVVAESFAVEFREDLLRAGHGHGHHGFAARLRTKLPPGPCNLALHLPKYGLTAPVMLEIPVIQSAGPTRLEDLLRARPGWTTQDLLARADCLPLAQNLAAQGASRFVDGLYRFVFARWPAPAEAAAQCHALQNEHVTPQELLLELLQSHERAERSTPLPSPFHPEFPFSLG